MLLQNEKRNIQIPNKQPIMKKCVFALALLLSGAGVLASCDKDEPKVVENVDPTNLDYNSTNAGNWTSYADLVARLLRQRLEDPAACLDRTIRIGLRFEG